MEPKTPEKRREGTSENMESAIYTVQEELEQRKVRAKHLAKRVATLISSILVLAGTAGVIIYASRIFKNRHGKRYLTAKAKSLPQEIQYIVLPSAQKADAFINSGKKKVKKSAKQLSKKKQKALKSI